MALSGPTTKLQAKSAESFGTGAYTTSSFTPSNNSLLVVAIRATSESNDGLAGGDITCTPSTGSATSRVVSTTSPGWSYGIRVWTIPITTGSSMTIQADCGAFNVHQYVVEVYEYTGHDTGTPTGATAVGSDADGDGAASITLSGSPASTSSVIAFASDTMTSAGTPGITNGAAFTEIYDNPTSGWSVDETQHRTGSTSTTVDWADLATTGGVTSGAVLVALEIKEAAGGSPATLTSPTPSGTLGTTTTATLGASTDQTSGTGYGVVDTAGNISGVTAAQVKAGQNNASAGAIASNNASVSASPFTIGVSGLTAGTLYSYAVVQNNANGDSNVVTGTFTTDAGSPTVTVVPAAAAQRNRRSSGRYM